MTAETTNNKSVKSFFGRRFFSKINENRKGLIVHSVLELLGLPVTSLIAVIIIYLENNRINYDGEVPMMFMMISVISLIISILLGAFFALSTFSYLYRKSLADMNYALPLNSRQRFFADYLSGLAVYFVPVICAVLLSGIIIGIGSLITDLSLFAAMIPRLIKTGIIVLIGMLMFYTISVLAITFCGSIFEAILSVLLINGVIPAAIACTSFMIYSAEGFGGEIESIIDKLIFIATSPIGATVLFVRYMEYGVYGDIDAFLSSLYVKWIIAALIVCGLFLIAAYLLYKHRKAEDISKPYVYKSYFYVMMGAAVFCILSMFFAAEVNAFGGILICAIGWFIMEVIRRRGFKRFWTAAVGFAAAVAVTFGIKGVCEATDGFGVYRYVPSDIGVEAVTLQVGGDALLDYNELTFKDKDVIKAVTKLQEEIIDRHENFDKYEYNIVGYDMEGNHDQISISIKYMMKSGSAVSRYYNVNSGMAGELYKSILLSDECAQYLTDMAAYSAVGGVYYNGGGYYDWKKEWDKIKDYNDLYTLDIASSLKLGDTKLRLSEHDTRQFLEGFESDMKSMTAEDLERGKVYCYIMGRQKIWVLDSFENTISFLEKHGYTAPEKAWDKSMGLYPEVSFEIYSPLKYTFVPEFFFQSYRHGYPWDLEERGVALAEGISSAGSYTIYLHNVHRLDLSRIDSNIEELFDRLTPLLFNEMPLAEVVVGENMFYLPDENDNAELLEMVMDSIDSFWFEDTIPDDHYYDNEDYYHDDYGIYEYEATEEYYQ